MLRNLSICPLNLRPFIPLDFVLMENLGLTQASNYTMARLILPQIQPGIIQPHSLSPPYNINALQVSDNKIPLIPTHINYMHHAYDTSQ